MLINVSVIYFGSAVVYLASPIFTTAFAADCLALPFVRQGMWETKVILFRHLSPVSNGMIFTKSVTATKMTMPKLFHILTNGFFE